MPTYIFEGICRSEYHQITITKKLGILENPTL